MQKEYQILYQGKIYLINQIRFTKMNYPKIVLKRSWSICLVTRVFRKKNYQRKRRRKIIRFYPPYRRNVKINIGKIFFALLVKHLPDKNEMHKIFNKNTAKVSYSWIKNMSSVISRYNRNKLNPKQESFGFNCRKIHSCSLNDEYLPPKVVYLQHGSNKIHLECQKQ